MDGQPCGEAEVEEIEGQFTYQLAILQQTSANELPCGELNQPISFTLNGTNLKQTAYWDNRVVHELPLVSPEALKTNKAGNFAWILVTSIGVILGGSGLLLYRRRGKKPLS